MHLALLKQNEPAANPTLNKALLTDQKMKEKLAQMEITLEDFRESIKGAREQLDE